MAARKKPAAEQARTGDALLHDVLYDVQTLWLHTFDHKPSEDEAVKAYERLDANRKRLAKSMGLKPLDLYDPRGRNMGAREGETDNGGE